MSKVKDTRDEEETSHLYQKFEDPSEKINVKINEEETSPIILENTANNEVTLRKLWIVSGICLVFMAIEITGGYLANSIAIMSDAAHLLSDFLGFIISIVSIYISRRGATHQMSFGYHRAEVIGALASVVLIWGLTIWLLYEATLRVITPNKVDGLIMLITAVIGFAFNIVMGLVLAYQGIDHNLHSHHDHEDEEELPTHYHKEGTKHSHEHSHAEGDHGHSHKEGDHGEDDHGHSHAEGDHGHSHSNAPQEFKKKQSHDQVATPLVEKKVKPASHGHSHGHGDHENVNLRAALIHVIGDAVQNLGVVIAGLVIYFYPSASIADPICTFIFSIIVVFTTIRILKDCISVLMEGSPLKFDMIKLEKDLAEVVGVKEIHDLHVWSLSVGKLSLSCHLTSTNPQTSLKKARKLIKDKYKISHATIQVELESEKEFEDCSHDLHHEINNRKK